MTTVTLFITAALLLGNGKDKNVPKEFTGASVTIPVKNQSPDRHAYSNTDTLQFIHFDGNFDYWYAVFINQRKDTVKLVTDTAIAYNLKNRLFEVKWFIDTLYEAGDNDSKYTAKRMSHFRLINGKPFVAPITEKKVLQDVKNIPEVQSGADQVLIAERPSEEKDFYLVETGSRETDNFSRFLMLRVYTYPQYMIKIYDAGTDTELSLDEWRSKSRK
ncbi:hypothetical protein DJ568_14370 [Mucilaginibacter hurinus]|uniref:Uncharacterized protein n=1 Tax=Mucilaginibacter hurinus TaxID=2201324 RepID=A0A367GMG5_9SPHI|nr:hypothetical protein [Mucilaginibacter hurinus]RCH54066.1 hypothetical protein DJ568_14370 [Mucilaginibacter hurinus]